MEWRISVIETCRHSFGRGIVVGRGPGPEEGPQGRWDLPRIAAGGRQDAGSCTGREERTAPLFPETVVAGCGNRLFADDGFGPAVAEELLRVPFPEDVRVVDAGTGGTYWVFTMLDPGITRRLIIADTADFGAEPGTIALFRPGDLPPGTYCDSFSWDIADPLDLIRDRIDVLVIGCQPGRVTWPHVEMRLSGEVRNAVPVAAGIIRAILGRRVDRTRAFRDER